MQFLNQAFAVVLKSPTLLLPFGLRGVRAQINLFINQQRNSFGRWVTRKEAKGPKGGSLSFRGCLLVLRPTKPSSFIVQELPSVGWVVKTMGEGTDPGTAQPSEPVP